MISLIIFALWSLSVILYIGNKQVAEEPKLTRFFGAIAFVLTIVMLVLTATKTWGNF